MGVSDGVSDLLLENVVRLMGGPEGVCDLFPEYVLRLMGTNMNYMFSFSL
jgi:hypothetical protein